MALTLVAVTAALGVFLPAQMINAPAVSAHARPGQCPGWNSTTNPPDYIRVLRRHSGSVDRVPFKKYVITVMGKEWPGYLPHAVIEAGAVAVKQFAWFHALGNGRMSKKGQCYDVTDGVGDQLYKPNRARVRQDHYAAVERTWGVRLLKHGTLFMTGYRTGNKGNCGHDKTGWKLYARSAVRCADRGMGYLDILRIYYGPVAVVGGSGKNASSDSDSTTTVEMSDDSAATDQAAAPATVDAASAEESTTTAPTNFVGDRAFSVA
jgi:peptidoglycan hydrolase-like amidase